MDKFVSKDVLKRAKELSKEKAFVALSKAKLKGLDLSNEKLVIATINGAFALGWTEGEAQFARDLYRIIMNDRKFIDKVLANRSGAMRGDILNKAKSLAFLVQVTERGSDRAREALVAKRTSAAKKVQKKPTTKLAAKTVSAKRRK